MKKERHRRWISQRALVGKLSTGAVSRVILAAYLGRAVGPRARVVVSPVPAATRPIDEGIVAGTKTFPLL